MPEGELNLVGVAMREFAFHRALEAIWQRLDKVNQYIDSQKPWELAKKEPAAVGRVLAPLGAWLGLGDWRFIVALLTSFVAKENTIATLGGVGRLKGDRHL